MPTYKTRTKDCKYYTEEAMHNLGWKVNDNIQEKYAKHECAVIYSGYNTTLLTNQSYVPTAYIKIIFEMDDNNEMVQTADEIIDYVTGYVKLDSHAPWSTTFIAESTDFIPNGKSYIGEITFSYYYERAWRTSEF